MYTFLIILIRVYQVLMSIIGKIVLNRENKFKKSIFLVFQIKQDCNILNFFRICILSIFKVFKFAFCFLLLFRVLLLQAATICFTSSSCFIL